MDSGDQAAVLAVLVPRVCVVWHHAITWIWLGGWGARHHGTWITTARILAHLCTDQVSAV